MKLVKGATIGINPNGVWIAATVAEICEEVLCEYTENCTIKKWSFMLDGYKDDFQVDVELVIAGENYK